MAKNPPGKEPTGDAGLIPKSGKSPGGGNGKPLQYSCQEIPWAEELEGLHPWGGKESDTTEQLIMQACMKMLENTCAGVVTRDSK